MTQTTLSWIDEKTQAVNAIWVDAVLLENYSRSADVTGFAIEGGATISDHVSAQQPEITLELFVSDTPVRVPETHLAAGVGRGPQSKTLNLRPYLTSGTLTEKVTQPGPVVGLPSRRLIRANKELARAPLGAQASVLQFTGKLERVANVFEILDKLLENGTPCKVSMKVGTFDNLLIKAIEAPRDSSAGTGIRFTVDFQRVRRVSSEQTAGTRKPKPKKPQNESKVDAGAKEPAEATPAEDASWAAKAAGTAK